MASEDEVAQQVVKKNMAEKKQHATMMLMFSLRSSGPLGRRGMLQTEHGDINTPFFLPVATAGAMKGINFRDLEELGAEVLLCNTYHLHLSPGESVVREAGGLHAFTGWTKPILTDSGGFQVFSLEHMRTIGEDGVEFRDHRSGDKHFLGPKEAMKIQHDLGADIIMCFDECPPSTAPRAEQIQAVDRTLRWAKVCKEENEKLKVEKAEKQEKKEKAVKKKGSTNLPPLSDFSPISSPLPALPHLPSPLLFGIVQGGLEKDLRKKCAEELIAIGFDGYAVGGLAVGESEQEMYDVLETVCPLLPSDKLRYLMGVGERHQITEAVKKGIDMFDCVSPMREARHGNIWLSDGTKLRLRRSEYIRDFSPLDPLSPARTSQRHSRAYVHHLLRLGERYGETIACLQNIAVILEHMRTLRAAMET